MYGEKSIDHIDEDSESTGDDIRCFMGSQLNISVM